MPMAFMAMSIPFACLQAFFEGLGRSYDWTIPALLPIYILRHGLLLILMAAAVWLGFEATAPTGYICLVLAMMISIAYQATTILYRLRRVVPPGPRAYRPREWIKGSAPFAVLYARAASLLLRRRVGAFLLREPGGDRHLLRRDAHHPGGEPHPLRGDGRDRASLLGKPHARRQRRAAAALPLGRGDHLHHRGGRGRGHGGGRGLAARHVRRTASQEGYVPLVILAAGVFARVSAGPAEDMLNMTGNSNVSASTYLAIVVVNVALAVALVIPFGLNGAAAASRSR